MDRREWPVRKLRLGVEDDSEVRRMSPAERLEMVWELTLNVWSIMGLEDEPRLRRDVVRVVRGGR